MSKLSQVSLESRFKVLPFYCNTCQVQATVEYEPSDFSPWESFCTCTACGFEWFQSTESLLSQSEQSTVSVDNAPRNWLVKSYPKAGGAV